MLAVPASIACAAVDDLAGARRHLAVAEASAARWDGSAWDAAVLEARAHLARAEGRTWSPRPCSTRRAGSSPPPDTPSTRSAAPGPAGRRGGPHGA